VVWQAVYKPFGEVHSITGSAALDYRFPGQWFMLETGLHYNWHRWYDASLGRYTQPDLLGMPDGPSRYAYALNSPLMFVDGDGTIAWVIAGALVGFAIEAAADYLERNCSCGGGSSPTGYALAGASGAVLGDNLDAIAKPRQGVGGRQASQVTSRTARLSQRIFGKARLPSGLPAPTLRRPFARSASVGRLAGRWAPIASAGYIGYDAYRIARCLFSE
jgi:RHS repeat-associated protein